MRGVSLPPALVVTLLAATTTVPSVGPAPALAQDSLPRVLLVATGGTIASRPGADQLTGRELVEAVPELGEVARLEVVEFSRIGSSAMTPDHWVRLARRVGSALADDPGLAGVVVTHGTDSMEETAYFLHLTRSGSRPVVVTGAMRSATAVSADGPDNLLDAVRVAVDPASRDKGVLVVMNDRVHGARAVRKTHDTALDAFRSPGGGALGVVEAGGVVFYRIPARRPGGAGVFVLPDVGSLPEVDIVSDYTGFRKAWAAEGRAGLVVQTFPGGRTSPGATEALLAVARTGTPVVLASRVPEGRVPDRTLPAPGGGHPGVELGVVSARDLSPWKARVLLILALTRTRDPSEIQGIFDRY